MRERQEIEQYFFDETTLDHLARFAARFPHPCCLCTPSLGAELERRGVRATTLDIDDRFTHLRGFRRYDILEAEPLEERFGLIICDPPFLSITLARLFEVVRTLSHGDFTQPILINYLASRSREIRAAFAPFGLEPTGFMPGYARIQNTGRNTMQFYGNLGPGHHLKPPTLDIRGIARED